MGIGTPFSEPIPTVHITTPFSLASSAASIAISSWSSPSDIITIALFVFLSSLKELIQSSIALPISVPWEEIISDPTLLRKSLAT